MSISASLSRFIVRALLALGLATAAASPAAAALQCVPYARAKSGIEIRNRQALASFGADTRH